MNAEGVSARVNPVAVAFQRDGGFDGCGGSIRFCCCAFINLNSVNPKSHGIVIKDQVRDGDCAFPVEFPGCGIAFPFGCDIDVFQLDSPVDAV